MDHFLFVFSFWFYFFSFFYFSLDFTFSLSFFTSRLSFSKFLCFFQFFFFFIHFFFFFWFLFFTLKVPKLELIGIPSSVITVLLSCVAGNHCCKSITTWNTVRTNRKPRKTQKTERKRMWQERRYQTKDHVRKKRKATGLEQGRDRNKKETEEKQN